MTEQQGEGVSLDTAKGVFLLEQIGELSQSHAMQIANLKLEHQIELNQRDARIRELEARLEVDHTATP